MKYIWQGQWINREQLLTKIKNFKLNQVPQLNVNWTFAACENLSQKLKSENSFKEKLYDCFLKEVPLGRKEDFIEICNELANFLAEEMLRQKVTRELSSGVSHKNPFSLETTDYHSNIFEAWMPLGFLVHIAPKNALAVPFLTLIEGLLAGNINFLKLPNEESLFTLTLVEQLISGDGSQKLKEFIMTGYLPIEENSRLKSLIQHSDGVVAWGTEEAIKAIRDLTPLSIPVIPWGPKISFAYFSRDCFEKSEEILNLAKDICILDQQSCSSPQIVYLDTEDESELNRFATELANHLDNTSNLFFKNKPSLHEAAQITQVLTLHKLNQALDEKMAQVVIEGSDKSWRVLIDHNSILRASPLFRTIWVKPLIRKNLVSALRPMRAYLQTAGLSCSPLETYELSLELFKAGVSRITPLGEMNSNYIGEPHDGVYALQRYSRRVGVLSRNVPPGFSKLEDLPHPENKNEVLFKQEETLKLQTLPLKNSSDILTDQSKLRPEDVEVYFKTGGTSGTPKLSIFTYDDYEVQMKTAGQGLFAAGLEPKTDRCINLFFSGGLYGGFLSFFTILEHLKAVQLPMAADTDFKKVGQWIVSQKVNVVLGMPSYLWQLFNENEELFVNYGGIQKVFYGGEHFSVSQKKHFIEKFGIQTIRSATYGSNETGPMGFQCQHSQGSVHHLHDQLQILEILKMDCDKPVEHNESGRMIVTSKVRHGQHVSRYEIGDIGKWVTEICPCGRSSPRFELLGRYGDIFKVGSIFLNYKNFANAFEAIPEYSGIFQIVISSNDELLVKYFNSKPILADKIIGKMLELDSDLNLVVKKDKMLNLKALQISREELEFVPTSGKLKSVIDLRGKQQ